MEQQRVSSIMCVSIKSSKTSNAVANASIPSIIVFSSMFFSRVTTVIYATPLRVLKSILALRLVRM